MAQQTVLIADDDLTILQLLRKTLSPYYEVIEANNGAEALEKALSLKPDCVVLDVMMPELNVGRSPRPSAVMRSSTIRGF